MHVSEQKLLNMEKLWNYSALCAFTVCVLLCQTICVTCQSSRIDKGFTLLGKPPDAQIQQETPLRQNRLNTLSVGNHFNKRPMVFRCSDMVPLFSARRNIQAQSGNSPFQITVSPTESVPGTFIQGVLQCYFYLISHSCI